MFIIVFQRIMTEAVLDIIYFPIWWFTIGIKQAAKWNWILLKDGNRMMAPGLWIANIFVPMYGQYDWQGRIISFFMRLVQIIARLFALTIWLGFCLILFLAWIMWPVLIVYGLYKSLI